MSLVQPTYRFEMSVESAVNNRVYTTVGPAIVGTSVVGYEIPWEPLPHVRSVDISMGRQDQLARFEPSRATVVVEDRAGDFSPFNVASPYYPGFKPSRPFRCVMNYMDTDFSLFNGQILRIVPSRPQDRNHIATVQCSDVLGLMARDGIGVITGLTSSFPQELTGSRVNRVLDLVKGGVPNRSIDVGYVTLPAVTLTNVTSLQHLQDIVEVEDGQFWSDGNRFFNFRARTARATDIVSTVSQQHFGGAGGIPISDIAVDYSTDFLYNFWRVTASGGVPQDSFDQASIDDSGLYYRNFSSQHILNDSTAGRIGAWKLLRFKTPIARVKSITIRRNNTVSVWNAISTLGINSRITVEDNLGGLGLLGDFYVEAIHHSIQFQPEFEHKVDIMLSEAYPIGWSVVGQATVGTSVVSPF